MHKMITIKSKGFGDYLQLAGGLAGAAASGMSMFDSLKIDNPGQPRTETHYGPAF